MAKSSPDAASIRADRARGVQARLPPGGLFADQHWRVSPQPMPLDKEIAGQLESLGRILLQFYRAANLLYRQSVTGRMPPWAAAWLDIGKPANLLQWQRSAAWKNDLPRVIRPDLLLCEEGLKVAELDSVPGGIGLTAWLNLTYSNLPGASQSPTVIGGARGMMDGFAKIFGDSPRVHVAISNESSSYRPEMEWLCEQLGTDRFRVQDAAAPFEFQKADSVYRFFEMFDLPNLPNTARIFEAATEKRIQLTPPPKPFLEEKMILGLLWNRNLRGFWRQELGESFFNQLQRLVPYTWILDPTPLPPHAAIPELNLTDWHQLKSLSQKQRSLILKVSGFSELAWGARGVYLGSDLPIDDWSAAVDQAIAGFTRTPWILQQYHKPRIVHAEFIDGDGQLREMQGRARLCPYYFIHGQGDDARAHLGGVLATICPADKKIIHGMRDAILAPCSTVIES